MLRGYQACVHLWETTPQHANELPAVTPGLRNSEKDQIQTVQTSIF